MKNKITSLFRSIIFQGFWEKVLHVSKIGMNHWGGASIYHSGEIKAMHYVKEKLKATSFTIFDIGANHGDYAKLAHAIFEGSARIFSFEPSTHTYEILVNRTNKIDRILPYKIGFGEKEDQLRLYSSGQGSSLASVYNLSQPLATFKEEYSELIDISTIDSFCKNNAIEVIDFMKIDIEGHELYALKGAKELLVNHKIKFIQFEFGECHIDSRTFFKDFYDLLGSNYTLYRIVPNGLRKINSYSAKLEIFHTANFLAEHNHIGH